MKKALILAGAALLVLVACNKSETVVSQTPGEISFKAVTGNITKAGELNGSFMPAATYKIYAAATQKNASGIIENPSFFSTKEAAFSATAETAAYSNLWRAATAVYWPIGGVKMDFLAYALPSANHAGSCFGEGDDVSANTVWKAEWAQSKHDIASILKFNTVDTYTNQVDMLYAAANNQTSAANGNADPGNYDPADASTDQRSVKLDFKHAQALLIFNVKVNDVAPAIKIDTIGFLTDERVAVMLKKQIANAAKKTYTIPASIVADSLTLKTKGTFTVDNSKIDLEAGWSGLVTVADKWKMPNGVTAVSDCNPGAGAKPANYVDYGTAIASATYAADTWYQLGETLLIPEQDKQKFTIIYTVGGKRFFYTYNDLKGTWQAGKKYIYNLDITINEIVITESVENFTSPTGYPMDVTLD